MNTGLEFAVKMKLAYSAKCKPICQEMGLPQTAFDILMFFSNNPEYQTARDIVEIRKIKANLVSVNVEKLVREGYLERRAVKDDRRKMKLLCTDKAQPVIQRGKKAQEDFFEELFEGIGAGTKERFFEALELIGINLDKILGGN